MPRYLAFLMVLAATASAVLAQPASIPTTYSYSHDMAPRMQWYANSGYCGEMSLITAGMHFGQYCSQFTARQLASPGIAQSDPKSQLLLGVNDLSAAKRMRLKANEFYNYTQENTRQFLTWVKSETLAGTVVIIGVFNNGILLGEWTKRTDGDGEYDHIVPVMAIGSNSPLEPNATRYLASDVITINDNGLYGPFGNPPVYQYLYAYRFNKFTGTRVQANNPRGPIYLLKNKPANYGISIEGPLDLDDVAIPVKLTSNVNAEPDMTDGSNTPPTPEAITLTATVEIPDQSQAYVLYRYDDFAKVPVANFNAEASKAVQSWNIPANSGATFTVTINTMSDKTQVFRAVPQDE